MINDKILKADLEAYISAKVVIIDSSKYVVITNTGKGKAENIKVTYDKAELKKKGVHIIGKNDYSEHPLLNSGEFFDLLVMTEEFHQELLPITVEWDDDRKGNIKDFVLSLNTYQRNLSNI